MSSLTRLSDRPHEEILRVEVRFKNARLFNAIAERTYEIHPTARENAVQRTNGPVSAFCRQHGLTLYDQKQIFKLLNLKIGPITRQAGVISWEQLPRPLCVKLAALLECSIDWLFPNELYAQSWPILTRDVDGAMMASLHEAPRAALMLPPSQHDDVVKKELSTSLNQVLDTLTPREAGVLRQRFGLDGEGERTMDEVADSYSVSRERIRQIEAKAFRKLRHPSRARPLRPFIEPMDDPARKPAVIETASVSVPVNDAGDPMSVQEMQTEQAQIELWLQHDWELVEGMLSCRKCRFATAIDYVVVPACIS